MDISTRLKGDHDTQRELAAKLLDADTARALTERFEEPKAGELA